MLESAILTRLSELNQSVLGNDPHLTFFEHLHGTQKSNDVMIDLIKMQMHGLSPDELHEIWHINKTYSFAEYPLLLLEILIIYIGVSSLKRLNISVFRVLLNNIYKELNRRGVLDFREGLSLESFFIENIFHLNNLFACNIEYKKIIKNLEFVIDNHLLREKCKTQSTQLEKSSFEARIVEISQKSSWVQNLLPYFLKFILAVNFRISEELLRASISITIHFLDFYSKTVPNKKLFLIFEKIFQPRIFKMLEPGQRSVVQGKSV